MEAGKPILDNFLLVCISTVFTLKSAQNILGQFFMWVYIDENKK